LYLLGKIIDDASLYLGASTKYINNVRRYISLALFSLAVKALKSGGAVWGKVEFSELLEEHLTALSEKSLPWRKLVRQCIDRIYDHYKREAKLLKKREGIVLSYSNYFKSQAYVSEVINPQVPRNTTSIARKALKK
jgi:hypothetical protein